MFLIYYLFHHDKVTGTNRSLFRATILIPIIIFFSTSFLSVESWLQNIEFQTTIQKKALLENQIRIENIVEQIEEYLHEVYSDLLYIRLDSHVGEMNINSQKLLQSLFDHQWSQNRLTEVCIIDRNLETIIQPYKTYEFGAGGVVPKDIHSFEPDVEEHQIEIEHVQRFISDPTLKAFISDEIMLCTKNPDGSKATGIVFSIPVRLKGELLGIVAGIIPNNRLEAELVQEVHSNMAVLISENGEFFGNPALPNKIRTWFMKAFAENGVANFFANAPKSFQIDQWGSLWSPIQLVSGQQWWISLQYDEQLYLMNAGTGIKSKLWLGFLLGGFILSILIYLLLKSYEIQVKNLNERNLMKGALIRSEKQYRELVEQSTNLITQVDKEGKFTYINSVSQKILGLSPEECIGKVTFDFVHPEDRFRTQKWLMQWQKTKQKNNSIENRQINSKTGEIHHMLWSSTLYYDDNGNFLGINGIARDISERKSLDNLNSVLMQISSKSNSALDLKELLQSIRSILHSVIDTTNFYVGMYDESSDSISEPYSEDIHDQITSYSAGNTLTGYVIKSGKPLLANEKIYNEMETDGVIEDVGKKPKLWLGVPLILKDVVIGALVVQSYSDSNLYSNKDIELLEHVSTEVANAIVRKQAEDNKELSNSLLQAAMESTADGILVVANDGTWTSFNQKFIDIWGIPDSITSSRIDKDALTCVLSSLKHPDEFLAKVKELYDNPEQDSFDEIKMIDDREFERFSHPQMLDGKVVGRVWSFRDVTDSKDVQRLLRKSEYLLSKSQKIAGIGSYVLDITKGKWQSSEVLNAIFGIDGNFVKDVASWLDIVHPSDLDLMQKYFTQNILNDHEEFNKEYRIKRIIDQKELWVHGLGKLEFDQDNNPITMIGTIQDITKRKKEERDKAILEAQLRRSKRLETIGTLAGGIAHDFNNVLTPIMGFTETIMYDLPESNPIYSDLEHILRGTYRARDLVEQILLFSKQGEKEPVSLDLYPLIEEALKLLRPSIPVTVDIIQRIDHSCGKIYADATQIHQIIVNLCTNAWHAMETGGTLIIELKQVKLRESTAKLLPKLDISDDFACLSISDTGHGIEEKNIDRIFEPFYTNKDVNKGTGLGLSVVHGIVQNHNGGILVESEVGKGTIFHVYLPIEENITREDHKEHKKLQTGNEKILVVDDDELVGKSMGRMLERLGYNIDIFTKSTEAIKEFQEHPSKYDLILSDLTMPGLTGLDLSRKVQKIRPNFPFVIATGYRDDLTRETIIKSGVNYVLSKPVMLRELSSVIRTILDDINSN